MILSAVDWSGLVGSIVNVYSSFIVLVSQMCQAIGLHLKESPVASFGILSWAVISFPKSRIILSTFTKSTFVQSFDCRLIPLSSGIVWSNSCGWDKLLKPVIALV